MNSIIKSFFIKNLNGYKYFKSLYTGYVVMCLLLLSLVYLINSMNFFPFYSQNFVMWDKSTLSQEIFQKIHHNVEDGFFFVKVDSRLFVKDPQLFLDRVITEGRMFNNYDIQNFDGEIKLLGLKGNPLIIPQFSEDNGVFAVFASDKLWGTLLKKYNLYPTSLNKRLIELLILAITRMKYIA